MKGTIVRITKRDGWAVLNADDDLAWAMQRRTRAHIYAFSMELELGRGSSACSTRAAAPPCSTGTRSCSAPPAGGRDPWLRRPSCR